MQEPPSFEGYTKLETSFSGAKLLFSVDFSLFLLLLLPLLLAKPLDESLSKDEKASEAEYQKQ